MGMPAHFLCYRTGTRAADGEGDSLCELLSRSFYARRKAPRYQLRAEAPGIYKALPATAAAMYAPELRGNSEDLKLEISK
jgi:hypothetical protein